MRIASALRLLHAYTVGIQRTSPLRIGPACLCMERTWLSSFLWGFLLIVLESLSCRSRSFARLEWPGFVSYIPAVCSLHDQKRSAILFNLFWRSHVLESDCLDSLFRLRERPGESVKLHSTGPACIRRS